MSFNENIKLVPTAFEEDKTIWQNDTASITVFRTTNMFVDVAWFKAVVAEIYLQADDVSLPWYKYASKRGQILEEIRDYNWTFCVFLQTRFGIIKKQTNEEICWETVQNSSISLSFSIYLSVSVMVYMYV